MTDHKPKKFPITALVILILAAIAALVYYALGGTFKSTKSTQRVLINHTLPEVGDEPLKPSKSIEDWVTYEGDFFTLKHPKDWKNKSDPKQSWIVFGPMTTDDYYIVASDIDLNNKTVESFYENYDSSGVPEVFSIDGHHAIFATHPPRDSQSYQYPFEQVVFIDKVKELITPGATYKKPTIEEGVLAIYAYAKRKDLLQNYEFDFKTILSTLTFTPLR